MERLTIDEIIDHCNRKVKWWEELIPREKFENRDAMDSACREYWEHRQVAEWLEQLKSYKDAEEQGLLLRLPCRVGDTVYHTIIPPDKPQVLPFEVRKIKILILENESYAIDLVHDSCSSLRGDIFGERVFLSKEEAEVALKKTKGEEHE